jgi:hypothetical protein
MKSLRNRLQLIPLLLLCCLACCLAAATALADISIPGQPYHPNRPPRPTTGPSSEQQLVVTTDASIKQARLRIPASALRPGAPGAAPGPRSDAGMSPARTVVAGIALTAAIAVSGLLLVRGRGARGRMLLLAALVASAGVLLSLASADVPRPPRPAPTPISIPMGGLKMPVVVEIVDEGPIQLTLPADASK